MVQSTHEKFSSRPSGKRVEPFTLEQFRVKALRRWTRLLNEEHWAWRPPIEMAAFFGAVRPGLPQRSPWRWLAGMRDKVMRAFQPQLAP